VGLRNSAPEGPGAAIKPIAKDKSSSMRRDACMYVLAWYVQIIFLCLYYIPTSSKYIYILSHIRDIRTKTTEVPFLSQTKNFLNNNFMAYNGSKVDWPSVTDPLKPSSKHEKQNILRVQRYSLNPQYKKSESEVDPI
jgi:hypothetical protein